MTLSAITLGGTSAFSAVRRLASVKITDAFLGTDLMIEDFEGYNGRVSDYNWEYGGTRDLLLPFFTTTS